MRQQCFAVRGQTCIDTIDPVTGLTTCYRKTLDECRTEYPTAERMTLDEFRESKAREQDTTITWTETTEARYYEMLDVLPPACSRGNGFLVGEPWDHHAITGRPRYQACLFYGGKYYASSRPVSVTEFLNPALMTVTP